MASDFLFELGCEELPSAAVAILAEALAANLNAALDKAQIAHGELRSFATPRRLAVLVKNLATEQPSQKLTRRGPALAQAYDANGKPTPALLGFAKSCQAELEDLTHSKTEKGEWLVHESLTQGSKTKDLLPAMINQALAALPIVKHMRWGKGDYEFVRPVHWALMLFNDEVIDCEVLGLKTGRDSYGHRFHHPKAIQINRTEDYESLLKEAFVIADFKTRKNLLVEQVEAIAAKQDARAVMTEALIDEVTSIVEWPQALIANFDEDFLDVPPEALIAAMQVHQKCFALRNSEGQLLPHFITVANIVSNNPKQVIAGNEKVMRARLSDAAFFFRQDKKQPLSANIPAIEQVVFQVKLGSLKDKTQRIKTLMNLLVEPLGLDKQQTIRAAELSKCDLMTGMVGEFPELQGLMGYYYARNDGEDEAVALALNEQYMPRFAGDQLPDSTLGFALSLTDRLDTLVGIFASGQKPSGVKDPFKLRRHALAVVRMLISRSAELNLSTLISEAQKLYSERLPQVEGLVEELKAFILERLQSYYQGIGFGTDLVLAVRARQEDWLYDFDKRIHALATFINLDEAKALSAACKRVSNILQQAQLPESQLTKIDESLLEEGAEKTLFTQLKALEQSSKPLYAEGAYETILSQLARLREPVDAFFESVMVMVDNQAIKQNRLQLLLQLQRLLSGVADISKINAS